MKNYKFTKKEKKSISAAVEQAEQKTSGEIATAFIKESNDYAKQELYFSITIGLIYFTTILFFIKPIEHFLTSMMWEYNQNVLISFIGFSTFIIVTISYLFSNLAFIDRLIISKKTMATSVHNRAMQHFAES
ncbi:MAG: hypothetical protein U9N34_07530, partial [Candidatus Cloacimonadota bacterium]|nr:hypothetical protein [Candidatus Cloacimonadota bacterium]